VKRLLQAVPAGTLLVGGGLAVLGVASYVHIAVANHSLDPAGQASVSVMWALVFALGIGLFWPIEQEVGRLVAARSVRGDGAGPVMSTAGLFTAGLLGLVVAVLLVGAQPIADQLFFGDRGMVYALCGAFAGLAAGYLTRGILSGRGRFGWYGIQLGVDGGLRIALAVAFGLAGVHSPVAFALILSIAPLVSVALTLPPVIRELHPGTPAAFSAVCRGIGLLLASSLLSQVIVNVGVINLKLLSPDSNAAVTAALLSALILARVPLFVFASLQASLLPALSRSVTTGDIQGYRRQLARALGVVGLLGLAGAVPAVLLGPWLVPPLFGVDDVLGRSDFAWLAAGTLAYMAAIVVGQAVIARGRHAVQAVGWLVGTIVLIAVTLGPGDVRTRVEVAFAVGSLSVIPVLAPFAWSRRMPAVPPAPEPALAAER
jgi:O-antigen/teichoic acid export membrane protein